MPFKLRVDKEFAGPTLCDLEPILDELQDPVEVRWTATKRDYLAYERHGAREVLMVVPDVETQEKTIWVLGGALELTDEDMLAAKAALTSRSDQTWRTRVDGLGPTRSTLLLTKVMADSLRAGRKAPAALSIALDCILQGVNPADADVLLRLRANNLRLVTDP
jgi:hypothetical protein